MNRKSLDCVTFRAGRSMGQMYLLLADARGSRISLSAMRETPAGWELALWLPPGKYRYRYYASCEGVTYYFSPLDGPEGEVEMDGLDGIRRVPDRHLRSHLNPQWEFLQLATAHFV